jgi:hypothetical protein
MGLLDLGIKAGGPITAEELAEGSGADAVLIGECSFAEPARSFPKRTDR